MPLLDFKCAKGHIFERMIPLARFGFAQRCECGAAAEQIHLKAPAFNSREISADRAAYMQHNVTFTGGTKEITHRPNEQALQCQCDGCRGHRKRARVTAVAEPMRRNKRVAKEVRV